MPEGEDHLLSLPKQRKTRTQKALRKSLKGTAALSNLLPTGTTFVFSLLSPVFTNKGQCTSTLTHILTICLLAVSAMACSLLCFTDSIRDEKGKVRYGFATSKGLWVIAASVKLSHADAEKYKLKGRDFRHAFMSALVFAVVAFCDQNVIKCFFPVESELAKWLLEVVPLAVGGVCSVFFLLYPTTRHGIGFPLSRE
ncbi:protein DMP7-like [Rhodamnia argentea]|uniref:Protein DMP7-like n=1 Tax=Rhodamnia argentea TaxID=178133 RepID=A0A8B8NDL3_9MYRT|nr:protein DMP7-like [Rhodamnia argentea]